MSLLSPQLEAFMAIVHHKTVHGAANILHITQTAVTQRIRNLEGRLETSLFVRTRRGMMLTPEGESLLRYCSAAQDLEEEALISINGAGKKTPIRVCVTGPTSIMRSRIIPQCFSVMESFPNLLMNFDIIDPEIRDKSLRIGDSQFAVIQQEDIAREMEYKLLKPENYILVCTSKWKGRSLEDIIKEEHIIDYNPADQMTFNYLKRHKLFHWANLDRHFVNRTESLAMMIVDGYGYGLLTKEFSQPYINNNQMVVLNSGKIYENTMALVWYERPKAPAYFSAFIDAIE